MRSAHAFLMLAFLTSGSVLSCTGQDAQLISPENRVRELTRTRVVASEFTLRAFDGSIDLGGLSSYPRVEAGNDGWTVRTWSRELGGRELTALRAFLENERKKYGTENREGEARARIERIRDALSLQPLDSALVSYELKRARPGASDFIYEDWLIFYFLDARSRTISEITNAFP